MKTVFIFFKETLRKYTLKNDETVILSLSIPLKDIKKESSSLFKNDEAKDFDVYLSREIVFESIMDVCNYRNWRLFALHVRTNHVHVVVSAETKPEKVLHAFKAYATRHLREAHPMLKEYKIWTRHGSTRYIWNRKSLLEAIHYVVHEQGEHMEYWYDKEFFSGS